MYGVGNIYEGHQVGKKMAWDEEERFGVVVVVQNEMIKHVRRPSETLYCQP